ncbi:MAG: immunoglobulin domain-containing protein, partial [Bacteroidota bacterium]
GGAVFNYGFENGQSNATLEGCSFYKNNSVFAGGAIFNNGIKGESSPSIINCEFKENEADTYGGAIYNQGKGGACNPMIVNCIFFKNKGSSAGGIYNLGDDGQCNPIITNCTFFGNEANVGGAIYSNATDETGECSPKVTNCIIWGNVAEFGPVFRIVYGTPDISYSLVGATDCEGMYSGVEGNITCGNGLLFDNDPMFEDAENGNLHLQPESPAIDKGSEAAISSTGVTTDLDQQARSQNGIVDMGAYEYGNVSYTPPSITAQPESKSICESESVQFSISVNGTGPFSYQWEKDGQNISGATESQLSLNNTLTSDAGNYSVRISGPQGESLLSTVASLSVAARVSPTIEVAASTLSICTGDEINFTTVATGQGDAPVYQWLINDNPIGGNSTSISLASLQNGDILKVVLTSSSECTTQNPVTSAALSIEVDVDPACTVSTYETIDPALVRLSPNPTSGLLQLQSSNLQGDFQLQFFNLEGQMLQSSTLHLQGTTQSTSIDLSAFPTGIYL